MRMAPLRTINRIRIRLHPAQICTFGRASGGGEVRGQRIARSAPLSALIARFGKAQQTSRAVGDINRMEAAIWMIGVAEYKRSRLVGCDVPGVECSDCMDFARRPIHAAKSAGPDGENKIASLAQESLMHDELIVAVLVQTFEAGAVAAHPMHARGGIAGKLD